MKKGSQIKVVRKTALKALLRKKEYRATTKAKKELEYSVHTLTNFVIERARAIAKEEGRKTIKDKDIEKAKWDIIQGKIYEGGK